MLHLGIVLHDLHLLTLIYLASAVEEKEEEGRKEVQVNQGIAVWQRLSQMYDLRCEPHSLMQSA